MIHYLLPKVLTFLFTLLTLTYIHRLLLNLILFIIGLFNRGGGSYAKAISLTLGRYREKKGLLIVWI